MRLASGWCTCVSTDFGGLTSVDPRGDCEVRGALEVESPSKLVYSLKTGLPRVNSQGVVEL